MAVPRNRTSNSRKNMRRSHHAKKAMALSTCPECKALKKPHHACSQCGNYKGAHI